MDKQPFYYRSDKLTAESATSAALQLLVDSSGIQLLALGAQQEVLVMEQVPAAEKTMDFSPQGPAFREFLASHPVANLPFPSVKATFFTPWAVLTPLRLFAAGEYRSHFRLLHELPELAIFGHQELREHGCCLVWAAPPDFQVFSGRFSAQHLAATLIREFHALAALDDHSVFLHVRGSHAQITVFDQRSLVFYNSFEFQKPTDLLYFVLLAYDQFKLPPERCPLWATGALLEESDHFKLLYKYIQNIHWVTPRKSLQLPPEAAGLPAHYWFDWMSL